MKTNLLKTVVGVVAATITHNAPAQIGGYTLDWFTLGGGGGAANGGAYTLDGTVGQTAASQLSAGDYAVHSGFWPGVSAAPTLSIRQVGTEAVLSWADRGFVLQSAPQASGPWADLSPGVRRGGPHFQVNAPLSGGNGFFQLRAGACIDFESMPAMSLPSPTLLQGANLETFDFRGLPSPLRIQARHGPLGSLTGLDCDHQLVIQPASPCRVVWLVLASGAQAATATAYDIQGAVTATATMTLAGQLAPETLKLQGSGTTRIVIAAPVQETLLLQLCWQ
jgi:hypothetical protein